VSIKPIYASDELRAKDCASHARITPEIMSTERLSTWVKAYDSESGRTLRCEVFLDTVHNVSISTTTHTMYRAAVEELSIDAFDASSTPHLPSRNSDTAVRPSGLPNTGVFYLLSLSLFLNR
jgi:hypothetical protein